MTSSWENSMHRYEQIWVLMQLLIILVSDAWNSNSCVSTHQEQLDDSKKLLTQLLAEQRHNELR